MFQKVDGHQIYYIVIFYAVALLGFAFYTLSKFDKNPKWSFAATILFFLFSLENIVCGLLSNEEYVIPYILQLFISYGTATISFLFYGYFIKYIIGYKEFYFFNLKWLLVLSVCSIAILISTYFLTNSENNSRDLFILPLIVYGLVLMFEMIYRIFKIINLKTTEYVSYKKLQAVLVLFSCFSLFLVVLSTYFGDYQIFEQTALTLSAVLILMLFNLEIRHNLFIESLEINNKEIPKILTDREDEIFNLIIKGYSYKEIATLLPSSEGNIRFHSKNIRDKLGFKTNMDLINNYSNNL